MILMPMHKGCSATSRFNHFSCIKSQSRKSQQNKESNKNFWNGQLHFKFRKAFFRN